ncbi:hypothetical protein GCM10023169_12400 [Georgenia halophila]|uniref:Glycerophosphoryl diester phosphodiesterase membrane domain-containing protein n=1 Tax=Georgenia halophila TaxID=620889 RepID=A0ABP8KUE1_9MICO
MSSRPEDDGTPEHDAGRYGPYSGPPDGEQPRYAPPTQHGQPTQPSPWGPDPAPQPGQYTQYTQPTQPSPWGGEPGQRPGQPWGQPPVPPSWGGDPSQQPGQYGQYGDAAQQQVPRGFTGADRPGIIPLRPMNIGEILDGAFRAIRANPRATFGLSLLVMGVTAVIEALVLSFTVGSTLLPLMGQTTPTLGMEELGTGAITSLVGLLAVSVAVYIASIVLTALLIVSVSQSVVGRVATIRQVWHSARGQLWRLIGLTLLLALGWTVVLVVVITALVLLGVALVEGGGNNPFITGLLIFLLFLGACVVMGYFVVRLTLSAPALMLERIGPFSAIRRSWALSRRQFWRLFGVLALAAIIVAILTYAMMIPLTMASSLFSGSQEALVITSIVMGVLSVLVSALTTPFLAAVVALAYIDIRMRKEGLDVTLAQSARPAEAG